MFRGSGKPGKPREFHFAEFVSTLKNKLLVYFQIISINIRQYQLVCLKTFKLIQIIFKTMILFA